MEFNDLLEFDKELPEPIHDTEEFDTIEVDLGDASLLVEEMRYKNIEEADLENENFLHLEALRNALASKDFKDAYCPFG